MDFLGYIFGLFISSLIFIVIINGIVLYFISRYYKNIYRKYEMDIDILEDKNFPKNLSEEKFKSLTLYETERVKIILRKYDPYIINSMIFFYVTIIILNCIFLYKYIILENNDSFKDISAIISSALVILIPFNFNFIKIINNRKKIYTYFKFYARIYNINKYSSKQRYILMPLSLIIVILILLISIKTLNISEFNTNLFIDIIQSFFTSLLYMNVVNKISGYFISKHYKNIYRNFNIDIDMLQDINDENLKFLQHYSEKQTKEILRKYHPIPVSIIVIFYTTIFISFFISIYFFYVQLNMDSIKDRFDVVITLVLFFTLISYNFNRILNYRKTIYMYFKIYSQRANYTEVTKKDFYYTVKNLRKVKYSLVPLSLIRLIRIVLIVFIIILFYIMYKDFFK